MELIGKRPYKKAPGNKTQGITSLVWVNLYMMVIDEYVDAIVLYAGINPHMKILVDEFPFPF